MRLGQANTGRRVTVVGAGIGGLTTALTFAQSGAEVTVLEQAPALTEVGAGVQISPNGMAVLRGLGLGPKAEATSIQAQKLAPTDALTGRTLAYLDVSTDDYHFFYRPDLIDLLAQGCADAGVRIRTGFRVTTGEDGIDLGSDDDAPDLIVGADGLHSNFRPLLNGSDAPFFTGQVAWRATIHKPDAPAIARVWMAPGRHVVTYPLRGDRLNIIAVREQASWTPDGWHMPDAPEAMQAAFSMCGDELRGILADVSETRLWGLFRHPVAEHWHGRAGTGQTIAILGDAAHPTLPFLAQGANLAIEDGWVLAANCSQSSDLDGALTRYQDSRRPRVSRAIKAANGNGANFHLSGASRVAAHTVLRIVGKVAPSLLQSRLNWIYRHDVTAD
ncbi:FAD-dependent monooxygenase [Flavimaricola marinus]|uniref:3-hydroxybenzoate 6-hydroxylase 1 n=1 Tax=Flavimaricola marinus TaxID=1819565 RepID=A0A238LJ61_9RHOB|nr:FAD-dependent monooxygenase [Flavimaricola marinus]SMY09658.1 3-hydroxybenzoate 6-hydroxylase 1 [Flavimaricola marinus]